LQLADSKADARARRSKHPCEAFLCEIQGTIISTICVEEEPTAKPLRDFVVTIVSAILFE
jgi:hypothetical protein